MNLELEGYPDILVEGVGLRGTGGHAHQEQNSGQEQQQMDGHLLQNFYGRRLPQVANAGVASDKKPLGEQGLVAVSLFWRVRRFFALLQLRSVLGKG